MSVAGRERNLKRVGVTAVVAALMIAVMMPAGASAANALSVHGSVNQVYVTGAQPGTSLRLLEALRALAVRHGPDAVAHCVTTAESLRKLLDKTTGME